jgi:hypothetical protein
MAEIRRAGKEHAGAGAASSAAMRMMKQRKRAGLLTKLNKFKHGLCLSLGLVVAIVAFLVTTQQLHRQAFVNQGRPPRIRRSKHEGSAGGHISHHDDQYTHDGFRFRNRTVTGRKPRPFARVLQCDGLYAGGTGNGNVTILSTAVPSAYSEMNKLIGDEAKIDMTAALLPSDLARIRKGDYLRMSNDNDNDDNGYIYSLHSLQYETSLVSWNAQAEQDKRDAKQQLETQGDNNCVPMHEWQTTFYPSCNNIHELNTNPDAQSGNFQFINCGTARCTFRIANANAIVRQPKNQQEHDADEVHVHDSRKEDEVVVLKTHR